MDSLKLVVALLLVLAVVAPVPSLAQEECPKGLRTRQLEQHEAELRRMAELYRSSGMGAEYTEMRHKIMTLQNQMPAARLEDGLRLFRFSRDPSCALGVFNYITGITLDIKPYTDGTWDLLSDGKVVREGLTDDELLSVLTEAL